ncbi:hypothetical protein E1262_02755 [Jiangella aurantiaca]|uniref:Uncharacterized protein n=1 Tax=Jiangella aurantiaca TaxID=2530373 RepID=A0A4R5AHS7_9ACTN|nr:hypothetical protein [Jiangella aurantiaca]TDD72258.1 hypothetical protein E1262_02755 [Jiangella aurantiaca]
MSELDRSGAPAPQRRTTSRARLDAGQSGSTLDISFVRTVPGDWSSWDYLPVDVHLALDRAGHAGELAFASGALPPEREVRGGVDVEVGHAWTVDDDALTIIDAVRPVHSAGREGWRFTIHRRPFVGEVKERRGVVSAGAPTPPSGSAVHEQDEPEVLDVLPAPVRRQVLATVPEPDFEDERLIQSFDRGSGLRQEACLVRATAGVVIAIVASRAITRSPDSAEAAAALAAESWFVHAVTASLGRVEVGGLDATQSVLDDRSPRRGLPGSRGTQIG